jgi:hypothetical protein
MMRHAARWIAVASLAGCLVSAALVFAGSMTVADFKNLFLAATVVWFGAAGYAIGR